MRRSTIIAVGHLTAPAVFSVGAAFLLANSSHDGLGDIAALLLGGFLFYSAPHLAWAAFCSVFKPAIRVQHTGFILCSCALALVCVLSFTVRDASGLPYQWLAYWPLAMALLFALSLGWFLAKFHALMPNPSLSPRPTTAGRLARAARWFMLHHAGKPSHLRGRG